MQGNVARTSKNSNVPGVDEFANFAALFNQIKYIQYDFNVYNIASHACVGRRGFTMV
jgi:hypothetical protein